MRWGLLLSYVGFWLATLVLPSSATDFSKLGPFAVGQQVVLIPDVTGLHPLETWIWYPAEGERIAGDNAALIKTTRDAPPATTGPYPLVVLIPGLDSAGIGYGRWGSLLASYGFVVFASNIDAALHEPPEGGAKKGEYQVPLRVLYNRPANVVRVIGYADALTAPGGKLAGVIDTSRIGVWGHSSGGTTAFQAGGAQIDLAALDRWCAANESERLGESCQLLGHEASIAALYGAAEPYAAPLPPIWDSRVAALVLAAPGGETHVFGEAGMAAVRVPTLIMVTADDAMVKPDLNAFWAYPRIGSQDKALAVFDEGGHMMFANAVEPQFAQAQALTVRFFLGFLKRDPAGIAAMSPDAVSSPTCVMRRRSPDLPCAGRGCALNAFETWRLATFQ